MTGAMRALVLLVAFLVANPVLALEPATTGVVVMHGKWGNGSQVESLVSDLRDAGFLVERPEMPWSGRRLFDRDFEAAMDEIDAAAERLRAKGATRIVAAGHSLGGAGALGYTARGRPLAAAVLIAPAHFPEGRVFLEKAADSVAKAREMVAAGHGDDTGSFLSLNDGNRSRMVECRAKDYLSYYAPDAAAAMSLGAPAVGGVPILWLAPKFDSTSEVFARLVRPRLPATTPLERIDIVAHHLDAPDIGRGPAVAWLKALP